MNCTWVVLKRLWQWSFGGGRAPPGQRTVRGGVRAGVDRGLSRRTSAYRSGSLTGQKSKGCAAPV